MFSTFGMSKARQEELRRAAQQKVSQPHLLGKYMKKVVRFVDRASDRLIERRLSNLDVSQSVVTRR